MRLIKNRLRIIFDGINGVYGGNARVISYTYKYTYIIFDLENWEESLVKSTYTYIISFNDLSHLKKKIDW